MLDMNVTGVITRRQQWVILESIRKVFMKVSDINVTDVTTRRQKKVVLENTRKEYILRHECDRLLDLSCNWFLFLILHTEFEMRSCLLCNFIFPSASHPPSSCPQWLQLSCFLQLLQDTTLPTYRLNCSILLGLAGMIGLYQHLMTEADKPWDIKN